MVDPGGLKAVRARAHAEKNSIGIKWVNNYTAYGIAFAISDFTYNGYTSRVAGALANGTMMVDDSVFTVLVATSQRGRTNASEYRSLTNAGINDTWCISFVSWVLKNAGIDAPISKSCNDAIKWYEETNNFRVRALEDGTNYHTPNAGDTFFVGSTTNGREHAGIVIAYDPPWVYTVEGSGKNVTVRKRHENTIYGYGRNGGEINNRGTKPSDVDITIDEYNRWTVHTAGADD